MFFDARRRFEQQRPNEYVRGLLAQYGNHGKPMQLNKPTYFQALEAANFRQRELEEMRLVKQRAQALEAQLQQSRKDARILAQFARQFLGQSPNDHGRGRQPHNGHTRGTPALLPKSNPTDADDARGAQEINSRQTAEEDVPSVAAALLQMTFFEICTVISARSVKAHYNLSRGNYKANKEAAVEWVVDFISSNGLNSFGVNGTAAFTMKGATQDDLADSLLLLLYYLDTYSNQLTSNDE